MITNKNELRFYLMADRMMNRGVFSSSFSMRIKELLSPDFIMRFLVAMRYKSYYQHIKRGGVMNILKYQLWSRRYHRISLKLGFSIGADVFGYGLMIPHWGTIVVGGSNRIGNYAVLHTSTCITDNAKVIGNALYLSSGAKITSHVTFGDNVSIAANSVVNKDCSGNALLVGAPAVPKRESSPWYIRDGVRFEERVKQIEELKKRMNIVS